MNLHRALPMSYSVENQQEDAAPAQYPGYTLTRLRAVMRTCPQNLLRRLNHRLTASARLFALSCATLFAATGCTLFSTPTVTKIAPAPAAVAVVVKPTALNVNAQTALLDARSLVAKASTDENLWLRAATLLKQAEAAAAEFDSPLTTKLSLEVSALCSASVKQLSTLPVKIW